MIYITPIIPLLPLISFVILIFFGYKLKEKSAYLSVFAILLSFIMSVLVLMQSIMGESVDINFLWMVLANANISIGYAVDSLSAVMLFVVSFVASLVQIYSIGYMKDDIRYSRFFAYLSIFSFAMLGLIISNNFITLFACWELVGLSSYLLIGFWFEKMSAAKAARKAFLVTKLGDLGFFAGIMVLFSYTGSFMFTDIFSKIPSLAPSILTLSGILLFCGAVGKSAQFPLHVWLPDAMEGPTPVSALIHAATMVAAGVYLVARTYPIFHFSEHSFSLAVVAYIGAITAFMAALIAVTVNDIKRILAYSTISQLGYMMMGLGVGGYSAGMFHLTTHAFFKALLFLGSGSVIHAVHTQDINEMGGLKNKMPITFWTFLIGTLALVGIPPFAGFFSKDEILSDAYKADKIIFFIALMCVFLTAFYMFRLCFKTFWGKEQHSHAHESPFVMTFPLIILAVFAAFSGFMGSPFMGNWFQSFIHFGEEHIASPNYLVMASSVLVGLFGMALAWMLYYAKLFSLKPIASSFAPVIKIVQNKFYIDEIYHIIIFLALLSFSKICAAFDKFIIDGTVNLISSIIYLISIISRLFDTYIVDGAVNLSAWITQRFGNTLRYLQSGFGQAYILWMVFFVSIAVIVFVK